MEKRPTNGVLSVSSNGANKEATYARSTGFNYSTADLAMMMSYAYIGALKRYPRSKVFVGYSELPNHCNLWTKMRCGLQCWLLLWNFKTCDVTGNLVVSGSRFNSTIQFKSIYPITGGGEDIDLVSQCKRWYWSLCLLVTAGVPETKVSHPWWDNNGTEACYHQITGWALGDSLCITD